jgi:hypothetical protein
VVVSRGREAPVFGSDLIRTRVCVYNFVSAQQDQKQQQQQQQQLIICQQQTTKGKTK